MFLLRHSVASLLSVACFQVLLAGCGGSSNTSSKGGSSSPGGSGSGGSSSATSDQGTGGTSSGGSSSGTPTTAGTSGSQGGTGGTEPTQPLDPSMFDPQEPTEPRTDGDRVEPGRRIDCPETDPSAGTACDKEGLTCTYGDTAVWSCRREYTCESEWIRRGADCVEPPNEIGRAHV